MGKTKSDSITEREVEILKIHQPMILKLKFMMGH
jgi:hypothetical protein